MESSSPLSAPSVDMGPATPPRRVEDISPQHEGVVVESSLVQSPPHPQPSAVADSSTDMQDISVSLSPPSTPPSPGHPTTDHFQQQQQVDIEKEQTSSIDKEEDMQQLSPISTRRSSLLRHPNEEKWVAEFSDSFQQTIAEPGRKALHSFFYPRQQQISPIKNKHKKLQKKGISLSSPLDNNLVATTTMGSSSPSSCNMVARPSPLLHKEESDNVTEGRRPPPSPLHRNDNAANESESPRQPITPSSRRRRMEEDLDVLEEDRQDREYVEKFWTAYDEIIILSLFTQLGILCRLGMASWFKLFGNVFTNDSALFTNLPLNCLSCFVMGLLCSGEALMQIITTRFTPPRLQQDLHREAMSNTHYVNDVDRGDGEEPEHDEEEEADQLEEGTFQRIPVALSTETSGTSQKRWRLRRRRSQRRRCTPIRRRDGARALSTRKTSWQPKNDNFQEELREVQLLALERRIRMSLCLVLFPVKKQDVDVVENYFYDGYQRRRDSRDSEDFLSSPKEQDSLSLQVTPQSSEDDYMEDMASSFENHDLALDEEICISIKSVKNDADRVVGEMAARGESPVEGDEFKDEIVVDDCNLKLSSIAHHHKESPQRHNTEAANLERKSPVGEHVTNDRTESDDSGLAGISYARQQPHLRARQYGQVEGGNVIDYGTQDQPDLDQIITNVATDVSQKISRIRRVRLVDGWGVGTTPEEKSEDLMLGLRDGLCGALSSFSSWISSMANLLRGGNIGQAFVGLVLGIQLPIVAYRFGQNMAVYIFVWRCRRETKRDIRRGYGIRLNTDEDVGDNGVDSPRLLKAQEDESATLSVRAIITALFIMSIVAQGTALHFFYEPADRLVALSLLVSPLGVLMRWRLSKFNSWRPNFPIGTFACNIGACALSGSLGSLLAGNPGPRERIVLVAIIAGFGGTLSSVARFVVEILAGTDPILFRMDGVYYAVNSVLWGLLVSFIFSASGDWADSVE